MLDESSCSSHCFLLPTMGIAFLFMLFNQDGSDVSAMEPVERGLNPLKMSAKITISYTFRV